MLLLVAFIGNFLTEQIMAANHRKLIFSINSVLFFKNLILNSQVHSSSKIMIVFSNDYVLWDQLKFI